VNSRGLILDFGGVLTTRFRSTLAGFCQREGLDPHRLHHVLREDPIGKATLYEAELGRISQREFELRLGKLLGVSDNNLTARICADLQPCEPMLALVERIRTAGIRTALLSNSWGAGDYDVYHGYDLQRLFDAIVISDQVGLAKPHRAIYELTADKMGTPATDCVFVDNVPLNLEPAGALGMTTVLVDEPADAVPEIASLFDLAIDPSLEN
jgi:putative hydrolase of the HAD superfamily